MNTNQVGGSSSFGLAAIEINGFSFSFIVFSIQYFVHELFGLRPDFPSQAPGSFVFPADVFGRVSHNPYGLRYYRPEKPVLFLHFPH
jgi:hypothetical protein